MKIKLLTISMALFLGSANAWWEKLSNLFGSTNSGEIQKEKEVETPTQEKEVETPTQEKEVETPTQEEGMETPNQEDQNKMLEEIYNKDKRQKRSKLKPLQSLSVNHYTALGLANKHFPWDTNFDEITCGNVDYNYKYYYEHAKDADQRKILDLARDAIYTAKQCDLFYNYNALGFVDENNVWTKNYDEITCDDIDENYKYLYEIADTNSKKRKLNISRAMIHHEKNCDYNKDLPLL